MVLLSAQLLSGPAQAATAVVTDSFDRLETSGWGTAPTGGAWTVSDAGQTSVTLGVAHVTAIRPGQGVTTQSTATSADTDATVTFSVPQLPTGGGEYIGLVLRRQADDTHYLAKVRITSTGTLSVGLSRMRGGVETVLGASTTLATPVAAGQQISLEGQVTGSSSVALAARAWPASSTAPAWQSSATDTSTSRISTAGAVGTWSYNSGSATRTGAVDYASLSATSVDAVATTPDPTPDPVPATDPAPVTSGSTGAATPGTTSYAVPAGAVFVSPSGSDSGTGSQSSPLKSPQTAVDRTASGGTIVLRAGSYHTGVKIPKDKKLTIQSYPGEAVWFEGSSVVSGWVQSGTTWVKSGWTASFDSHAGFNAGTNNTSFLDPAYPMAAHPDQVWVDGVALSQVSSAAKVVAGTFYVNYSTDQLIIGSNPSGKTVRASDLADALWIQGPGSKIAGVGVRRYATPSVDMGTVRIAGSGVTLENVLVTDNANVGVVVAATKARLAGVTSNNNGMLGLQANYADGLVASDVLADNNNVEHYNTAPVSGGFKITRSRGLTIQNSSFTHNRGPGLWFDESCYDAKVVNNRMVDNLKHGMAFEISSLAVIADNVITGNPSTGMKINDATNVRIWNNTIGGNGKNIDLVQDTRRATDLSWPGHDPRQSLPDPTVTWLLGNVQFMNNLVSKPTSTYGMYVRDYSGARSAAQMGITVNGSQFNAQPTGTLVVWGITASTTASYKTVDTFESGAKQGPYNGDSATTTAPLGLPSDIAALVGQAAGAKKIGAF